MKKLIDDENEIDVEDESTMGSTEIAKMRTLDEIKLSPTFQNLFPLNEDAVDDYANSMKEKGFDNSQPIHIWKEEDICIDGHTRLAAAKKANLFEIPVYEHSFKSEKEALLYALSLQVNRRNLSALELVNAISKYQELGGKKVSGKNLKEDLSKSTGVSQRTIAKAMVVAKDDDAVEDIKNGATVNAAYETLQDKKNPERKAKKESKKASEQKNDGGFSQDETDSISDISESLSTNEGTPAGLNFSHSDGHERPHVEPFDNEDPDNETDKLVIARRESRTEGKQEGYEEGLGKGSEIAFAVFQFALAEISKGRSPKEVFNDERVADFSPSIIQDFVLPEDDEEIINKL